MDPWLTLHASLSFFSLAMAIVSFWAKRSAPIWGGFLLLSLILAYFSHIITPIALIPIGALLILHPLLIGETRGLLRLILFLTIIGISLCLIGGVFPGFHYWTVYQKLSLSPHSYPTTFGINYGKVFIGFFVLAWGLPLAKSVSELEKILRLAFPLSLLGIVALLTFSLFSGLIAYDPKLPPGLWFFLLTNLIFVTIMEEAFWRGFVQEQLRRFFRPLGPASPLLAILVTSLFFALTHYFWVPHLPFLGLIFLASLIYGALYQITRAIEGSILCHFLLNATHITLFTYPLLLGSIPN